MNVNKLVGLSLGVHVSCVVPEVPGVRQLFPAKRRGESGQAPHGGDAPSCHN